MTNYHLGLSAYFHDSAAALVSNGRIIAATQQERFSRKRHDSGLPIDAIRYCIDTAGIRLNDLTTLSYYENPSLKLRRTLSSFASAGPGGLHAFTHVMPEWIRWKARPTAMIRAELRKLGMGEPPKEILCEPPRFYRRLLIWYFKLRFCLTSRLAHISPPLRLV